MPLIASADLGKSLYVPAASVSLGTAGADLLRVHGLAVTQVEVDLGLSMAGKFRFTVPNTFSAEQSEFLTARGQPALSLLKLGTRVWIRMGYGDRSGQPLLLSGYITTVGTNFNEGASPDLEVSGEDVLYPLTLGTNNRRFRNQSLRVAVTKVAADNGLSVACEDTLENVTLDANMESDMTFLRKLAAEFSKKEKWEFFARPSESADILHFRPRGTTAREIATLKWGVDLLSFKPDATVGNQVGKVAVHGWDELAKKPIRGEARPERGPAGEKPGGEIQRGFLNREVVREVRLPVTTKQEADARAAAEFHRLAQNHVKGEGETFGIPDLLPNTRVKLEGLGAKFSRSYYVTKTVHRFNASGYRTVFSFEEPDS